ncbi:short-subunit dehydrogenase [Nocardia tenerifensis]|uniref:Short-subunit dehydrogenase n=1 Tax=Nocardia tenerifensis TaxID=228006 RepID=A0A318K8J2_9NOCA|nr:SDR family oxidoreductase [Nocardia tenerifensis]PXX66818.1 short-subunit dehydrogenase [Nocardia tenerifensis]
MTGAANGEVSLGGKVVAITGGARGIGRATAEAFLRAGAAVAIGDVDVELVAKTAVELGADPDAKIIGLPLNVTDRESFATFLDRLEESLGPLDVLVNNAGIMPTGLFADEDEAMTDRIIDINLRGVVHGSRLAAGRFLARGGGHLINIASLAGTQGFPGLATYCATKHAVVGFTSALHLELKEHGVRVSAVLPGIVRTELSAGANMPGWIEPMTTVDPEDVAQAIVRAVATGKPLVTVPRRLAAIIKSAQLLPYRAQLVVARFTGATTAYAQPDPEIRERYHRRLREQ